MLVGPLLLRQDGPEAQITGIGVDGEGNGEIW